MMKVGLPSLLKMNIIVCWREEREGDKIKSRMYLHSESYFRKDHVKHEEVAAKHWPDTWNFLTTKYEDVSFFAKLLFFILNAKTSFNK